MWKEFTKEAAEYYKTVIRESGDEPEKVSVHIFDEYWDILNKRARRKIETIHLNGDETKIIEYIKNFLKPETKDFYEELGIPYKLNILFEGLPEQEKQV